MIDKNQVENIKKQLISQLEASDLSNKEEVKSSIQEMSEEELEEFLIKNKLIKSKQDLSESQCVFCSIAEEKIPSYKLDENEENVAVLEINPISKGHILVIPKKHIPSSKDLPSSAFSLAKKISKKVRTKLKPKEVKIETSNLFGHKIINILPIYKEESLSSKRSKASEKELLNLQKIISTEKKPRITKIKKPKAKLEIKEKLWLPKRMP